MGSCLIAGSAGSWAAARRAAAPGRASCQKRPAIACWVAGRRLVGPCSVVAGAAAIAGAGPQRGADCAGRGYPVLGLVDNLWQEIVQPAQTDWKQTVDPSP